MANVAEGWFAARDGEAIMRIGLTGGIGSGKSTVAGMFAEHGFVVVDADALAREVVAPGQPALAAIADRFGDDVIRGDGSLDRAALASIVFADDAERRALEAITHPAIRAEIARREQEARASDRNAIVVVDHPLLIETGQVDDFDGLVVVVASTKTRLARLVEDRGIDPDDARARMAVQADDDARRAAATWLIDNDGDLPALERAVADVAEAIRSWPGPP
ncbi:MAG TPA: dephospho-CoA kinase [Nitriliruptoraceae bacterium]|nr:dephospho-CoA kinase [Nitriliruptoraceae bacterium]